MRVEEQALSRHGTMRKLFDWVIGKPPKISFAYFYRSRSGVAAKICCVAPELGGLKELWKEFDMVETRQAK